MSLNQAKLQSAQSVYGENNQFRKGLPAWTYNNQELSELEMREIFLKNWNWVGHVSELPQTGHYKCIDLAGEKAIVVRGEDDEVRAFHNYCRHRGVRLVKDSEGRCGKSLICPFHGWSYHLDGRLKNIPRADTFPPIDNNEFSLKPLDCEIWHGLIFVRFDGDGPSMAETLAEADSEISMYKINEMKPYGEPWRYDFDFDWKLIVDIDSEGYHLPTGHPEMFDLLGKTYKDEVFPNGLTRSSGSFKNRKLKSQTNKNYVESLPASRHLPESHADQWIYWGAFPGFVITLFPDLIEIYQIFPTDHLKSAMAGRSYALEDERPEMQAAREFNRELNNEIGNEDIQLITWASEAMQSMAFDGLLLSDLEVGVAVFQNQMRKKFPVVTLDDAPQPGQLDAVNRQMMQ